MELLIIRHGQSQADLEDRHEGRADFPLTQLGVKQAQLLAEWVQERFPPELILASPLQRASRTAEILRGATGAPLQLEPALMEWNNGLLAGLARQEAAERFPLPPGGRRPHDTYAETEFFIEFRARVEMFWSKFTYKYILPGAFKRIALVSHAGTITQLFRCFLGLPVVCDCFFSTGDTGVHLWSLESGRRTIVFANSLEHLQALG